MHNCTSSFFLSLRVQVTEVVSLRNKMFALLIRSHSLGWNSSEYSWLICMCQVGLLLVHQFWGDFVAAVCVRHHVSGCSLRLSVTLLAAADYKPYLNQQTVCRLFLCLWPRIVVPCFGQCLSQVPIARSFSCLCGVEAHIAEQMALPFSI